MSELFTRKILRAVVIQICKTIGYSSVTDSSLDLLQDLLHKFLLEITRDLHMQVEHCGRVVPCTRDAEITLARCSIDIQDLLDYINNVDAVPFFFDLPNYPIKKPENPNYYQPRQIDKQLITHNNNFVIKSFNNDNNKQNEEVDGVEEERLVEITTSTSCDKSKEEVEEESRTETTAKEEKAENSANLEAEQQLNNVLHIKDIIIKQQNQENHNQANDIQQKQNITTTISSSNNNNNPLHPINWYVGKNRPPTSVYLNAHGNIVRLTTGTKASSKIPDCVFKWEGRDTLPTPSPPPAPPPVPPTPAVKATKQQQKQEKFEVTKEKLGVIVSQGEDENIEIVVDQDEEEPNGEENKLLQQHQQTIKNNHKKLLNKKKNKNNKDQSHKKSLNKNNKLTNYNNNIVDTAITNKTIKFKTEKRKNSKKLQKKLNFMLNNNNTINNNNSTDDNANEHEIRMKELIMSKYEKHKDLTKMSMAPPLMGRERREDYAKLLKKQMRLEEQPQQKYKSMPDGKNLYTTPIMPLITPTLYANMQQQKLQQQQEKLQQQQYKNNTMPTIRTNNYDIGEQQQHAVFNQEQHNFPTTTTAIKQNVSTPAAPTPPATIEQHPLASTTTTTTASNEVKIPKKRGRKPGSKNQPKLPPQYAPNKIPLYNTQDKQEVLNIMSKLNMPTRNLKMMSTLLMPPATLNVMAGVSNFNMKYQQNEAFTNNNNDDDDANSEIRARSLNAMNLFQNLTEIDFSIHQPTALATTATTTNSVLPQLLQQQQQQQLNKATAAATTSTTAALKEPKTKKVKQPKSMLQAAAISTPMAMDLTTTIQQQHNKLNEIHANPNKNNISDLISSQSPLATLYQQQQQHQQQQLPHKKLSKKELLRSQELATINQHDFQLYPQIKADNFMTLYPGAAAITPTLPAVALNYLTNQSVAAGGGGSNSNNNLATTTTSNLPLQTNFDALMAHNFLTYRQQFLLNNQNNTTTNNNNNVDIGATTTTKTNYSNVAQIMPDNMKLTQHLNDYQLFQQKQQQLQQLKQHKNLLAKLTPDETIELSDDTDDDNDHNKNNNDESQQQQQPPNKKIKTKMMKAQEDLLKNYDNSKRWCPPVPASPVPIIAATVNSNDTIVLQESNPITITPNSGGSSSIGVSKLAGGADLIPLSASLAGTAYSNKSIPLTSLTTAMPTLPLIKNHHHNHQITTTSATVKTTTSTSNLNKSNTTATTSAIEEKNVFDNISKITKQKKKKKKLLNTSLEEGELLDDDDDDDNDDDDDDYDDVDLEMNEVENQKAQQQQTQHLNKMETDNINEHADSNDDVNIGVKKQHHHHHHKKDHKRLKKIKDGKISKKPKKDKKAKEKQNYKIEQIQQQQQQQQQKLHEGIIENSDLVKKKFKREKKKEKQQRFDTINNSDSDGKKMKKKSKIDKDSAEIKALQQQQLHKNTTVVPKITLKLTGTNSPINTTTFTASATATAVAVAAVKNTDDKHIKTTLVSSGYKESSPELARFSALVTRPPKHSKSSASSPPLTTAQEHQQFGTGIGFGGSSLLSPMPLGTSTLAASSVLLPSQLYASHQQQPPPQPHNYHSNSSVGGVSSGVGSSSHQHHHSSSSSSSSTHHNILAATTTTTPLTTNKTNEDLAALALAESSRPSSYIDAEGNRIWICPACGKVDDGSAMIGCDGCDAWYHWVCVGITVAPSDVDWFCRVCIHRKQGTLLTTTISNTSDGKKRKRSKKK